ncbi:MAG: heme ABC transporter ATP-binding protein [Panacagrimonas sp.]
MTLAVAPGEVLAVLGRNGAGKSTLLHLLARDLRPNTGDVHLNGKPLDAWTASQLARQRAVLPQSESLNFSFPVEEVVALGRFPWTGEPAAHSAAMVKDAMQAANVAQLSRRPYLGLSGGERARVQFARVLAQIADAGSLSGRYLLLDEPTARLDLAHQHEILAITRGSTARGLGVVVVVHDPNLALLYADRVAVLDEGTIVACGMPDAVLTPARIETVFGLAVERVERRNGQAPVLAPVAAAAGVARPMNGPVPHEKINSRDELRPDK